MQAKLNNTKVKIKDIKLQGRNSAPHAFGVCSNAKVEKFETFEVVAKMPFQTSVFAPTINEKIELLSPQIELTGVSVCIISINDFEFSFFGSGCLKETQFFRADRNYWLLKSNQFEPLTKYSDMVVGRLFITSNDTISTTPLYFNKDGIWFSSSKDISISNGASFSFTMLLILSA